MDKLFASEFLTNWLMNIIEIDMGMMGRSMPSLLGMDIV